jgi:hypothetical protein
MDVKHLRHWGKKFLPKSPVIVPAHDMITIADKKELEFTERHGEWEYNMT